MFLVMYSLKMSKTRGGISAVLATATSSGVIGAPFFIIFSKIIKIKEMLSDYGEFGKAIGKSILGQVRNDKQKVQAELDTTNALIKRFCKRHPKNGMIERCRQCRAAYDPDDRHRNKGTVCSYCERLISCGRNGCNADPYKCATCKKSHCHKCAQGCEKCDKIICLKCRNPCNDCGLSSLCDDHGRPDDCCGACADGDSGFLWTGIKLP